jgi:hypothetical protein
MIYVECKPDEMLVRTLLSVSKRDVVHELKGKFEVINRISNGVKGLVDEDPGAYVPVYLQRTPIADDIALLGLRRYTDTRRGNHVVVLLPRLEGWLLAAADDASIRVGSYGLPERVSQLRGVINDDLRKVERLVADLNGSGIPRMRTLRQWLT